jgi:CRISPR-associated protein Csm1
MRFAVDFRKEFSKLTNNNPSVTLSGGIALADPHLPVRAIAAMAEEAHEEAKDRKDKNTGYIIKNGVSVFGVTVSWEEYEKSLEQAQSIKQYIDRKIVSVRIVYKMIDFANRAKNVDKGKLRDLLWMSNYHYTIVQNIDPRHGDALGFFLDFANCPDKMKKSRIAVSYALYERRDSNN